MVVIEVFELLYRKDMTEDYITIRLSWVNVGDGKWCTVERALLRIREKLSCL